MRSSIFGIFFSILFIGVVANKGKDGKHFSHGYYGDKGKDGKHFARGTSNSALKWVVDSCAKDGQRNASDRESLSKCVKWSSGVEHESFIIHRKTGDKREYVINSGTIAMQLSRHGRAFGLDRNTHAVAVNLFHTGVEFSGRACAGINEINFKAMAESVSMDHKQLSYDEAFCHISTLDDYIIDVVSSSPGETNMNNELGTIERPLTGMSSELGIYTRTAGKTFKCDSCDGCDLTDYTGSYHATLSLPRGADDFIAYDDSVLEDGKCSSGYVSPGHSYNSSIESWVAAHINFANQFQWIEPLLLASMGSADSSSVCDDGAFVEGSYRMSSSGWGVLGTSDVRTLGESGIGRYTHTGFDWLMDSLPNREAGLFDCVELGMGSDIRTISDIDEHSLPVDSDLPPMKVGQGIEFRIFDNFPIRHFPQVLNLIALLAENSRVHTSEEFIYDNVDWAEAAILSMGSGHDALLPDRYITDVAYHLNIDLSALGDNVLAFDVFSEVYKQLWEKNSDGFWFKLLIEDVPEDMPVLSNPNRESWEIGAMNAGYTPEKLVELFNGVTVVEDMVVEDCTSEDYGDLVYLADSYGMIDSMDFNDDGSIKSFVLVEGVEDVQVDINTCLV